MTWKIKSGNLGLCRFFSKHVALRELSRYRFNDHECAKSNGGRDQSDGGAFTYRALPFVIWFGLESGVLHSACISNNSRKGDIVSDTKHSRLLKSTNPKKLNYNKLQLPIIQHYWGLGSIFTEKRHNQGWRMIFNGMESEAGRKKITKSRTGSKAWLDTKMTSGSVTPRSLPDVVIIIAAMRAHIAYISQKRWMILGSSTKNLNDLTSLFVPSQVMGYDDMCAISESVIWALRPLLKRILE